MGDLGGEIMMMIDRVDALMMCVQSQLETIEQGYVRAVVHPEIIEEAKK